MARASPSSSASTTTSAAKWTPSHNPEHVAITNPATGEALGSVPMGSAKDVDAAVKAAQAAFPAWRELPAQTRARFLFELRDKMEEHYDELLSICTQEHGKTLEESKGDVRRGIDNVEVAVRHVVGMLGHSGALEQIASGIDSTSVRQPMGVFAIIAPYNFPVDELVGSCFAVRDRVGEHRDRQAKRAGPILAGAPLRADARGGASSRGRQHGERGARYRERHRRPPRHRWSLVRGVVARRQPRLRALRRDRQARPGARRGEELRRRDGRRREREVDREHRRQRDGLRGAAVPRAQRRHRRRRRLREAREGAPGGAREGQARERPRRGRHDGPGHQRAAPRAGPRVHREGPRRGRDPRRRRPQGDRGVAAQGPLARAVALHRRQPAHDDRLRKRSSARSCAS